MTWTAPPPPLPPGPQRPIRTGRVFAGIGVAFAAQVVAILIGLAVVLLGSRSANSENALIGLYLEIALQLAVFAACLTVGIIWIVRKDRGFGLGLLIGWAVSVLVFPVAGIGICVAILSQAQQ
jgi:hypothetical protein